MELEEFKQLIGKVEGLCLEEDCFLLYSLVKDLKLKADILEIGSFKGRVSIALAVGLKESRQDGKAYSIDANLFGTKSQLLKNIERFGVKDLVIPIFTHSAKANKGWRHPLKLIWIDTDGNYFSVKCDFLLWERYLVVGGAIALSAAMSSKIERFVRDCIVGSKRFERITNIGSIVFAYKNKETPPYKRWKIEYIRLIYSFYFALKMILYKLLQIFPSRLTDKEFTLKKIINRAFEILLRK